MFSLFALASYAVGAEPVTVRELGETIEVAVTCELHEGATLHKKPVPITVQATSPLVLEGPAPVSLDAGSLSFVTKVMWANPAVSPANGKITPVTVRVTDKKSPIKACVAAPVELRPKEPSLQFQAGDESATLDPSQPLFSSFLAGDEDDRLRKVVVTLSLVHPGGAGGVLAPPPLGRFLSAPTGESGVNVTIQYPAGSTPPSVVLTLEADPEVSVGAETFNKVIRAVRLNPTVSLPPEQLVQVAVAVTDAEGLTTTAQTQLFPISAIIKPEPDSSTSVKNVTLLESGREEHLTIECTVPNLMIKSTRELRLKLSADAPVTLESKELVKAKAAMTEVVTFDVGARWSEAQVFPANSATVKAEVIDEEYAGTVCTPVTVQLEPKPPTILLSAGGKDAQSFQPGEALFGQVVITDEDALIHSATVVLRFATGLGRSPAEVYWALVEQVILSVPAGEPGIVHSMLAGVANDGRPELKLTLTGRSTAASYQRVLSSIVVPKELVLAGVTGVEVSVTIVDADQLPAETTVSMPSQAWQVEVYPQSVVRLRLVEFPTERFYDPRQIAAIQNENVFVRTRDGLQRILVQALVEVDPTAVVDTNERADKAIAYVDVSVVLPGDAPNWEKAARATLPPLTADEAKCESDNWIRCDNWSAGANVAFFRQEELNSVVANTPIERDVYVRLQLEDGAYQVIGPRKVSVTWWDDAPLYEISIAARPAAFGVTHVYCQDVIDSGAASSSAICDATPFDHYWTTGLSASPVSLHARFNPLAKFPVFGLSMDMALTVLSTDQQVLGYGALTGTEADQSETDALSLDGQFQATVGLDLRLPINDRPIDVMFYVGSYQRDVEGASRLRMTTGVALIAPILIADQNDVDRARFKLSLPTQSTAEVADEQ